MNDGTDVSATVQAAAVAPTQKEFDENDARIERLSRIVLLYRTLATINAMAGASLNTLDPDRLLERLGRAQPILDEVLGKLQEFRNLTMGGDDPPVANGCNPACPPEAPSCCNNTCSTSPCWNTM